MWSVIEDFRDNVSKSGILIKRRKEQTIEWVRAMAAEYLQNRIARCDELTKQREEIERRVIEGAITPTTAAKELTESMEKLLFTNADET